MFKRPLILLLLCAVLAAAAGCSKRHKIRVESDACWNGTVNDDQYIDGCGNSSYRILGTLRCVRVQKSSVNGTYVRVRIDEGPWAETADRFGIVQACN